MATQTNQCLTAPDPVNWNAAMQNMIRKKVNVMKAYRCWMNRIALSAALVLVAGSLTAAENRVRLEGQPGSKMQIDGDSTIHAWTVAGQIISGFMEFDASVTNDLSKVAKANPKVEVTVPVRSLKAQITAGKAKMESVMAQALKNDKGQNPNIKYRLLEMTLKEPPKSPTGPVKFDTKGELTVSGVTRTNSMVVTMEMVGPTNKVTGSVAMKMTDFNVKPPVLLGLLTTADDIKVSFEWLALPVAAAPKTAEAK